jgi:hypothetical protein
MRHDDPAAIPLGGFATRAAHARFAATFRRRGHGGRTTRNLRTGRTNAGAPLPIRSSPPGAPPRSSRGFSVDDRIDGGGALDRRRAARDSRRRGAAHAAVERGPRLLVRLGPPPPRRANRQGRPPPRAPADSTHDTPGRASPAGYLTHPLAAACRHRRPTARAPHRTRERTPAVVTVERSPLRDRAARE